MKPKYRILIHPARDTALFADPPYFMKDSKRENVSLFEPGVSVYETEDLPEACVKAKEVEALGWCWVNVVLWNWKDL